MSPKKTTAKTSGIKQAGRIDSTNESAASMAGTKDGTQKYHHGNLFAALVDAALRQLAGKDADAISLRGLATQVGVSVAAVYRHFPSKEALLAEIATDGFVRLSALCKQALPRRGETGARERLQRLSDLYIEFALGSPAHFRLMFGHYRLNGFPALRAAADCSFGYVVDVARGIAEEAGAQPEWVMPLANAAWSLVHGYVHLEMGHLLTRQDGKPDLPPMLLTHFLQLPPEAVPQPVQASPRRSRVREKQ